MTGSTTTGMRFITTDAGNIGQKRKQVARACDSCRKRKRRCGHVVGSVSRASSPPGGSVVDSNVFNASSPKANVASSSPIRSDRVQISENEGHMRQSNHDRRRFIGDLNPEGEFLSATSPDTARRSSSFNENIGTWFAEKLKDNEAALDLPQPRGIFYGSASLTHKMLIRVMEEECMSTLPPGAQLGKLQSFYVARIHPILPIINLPALQEKSPNDPSGVLLSQGICLLASMNRHCKQWLLPIDRGSALEPREFARRIFASMRCSVEIGLVSDRLDLLQAMACMGLFAEGPDGADVSSQYCARSVHTVHTLGLHLTGGHNGQTDEHAIKLLCCVWTIDRLNAAFHGRPVLLHERDVGRDLGDCFSRQSPEFRLLLRTVSLLDQVIGLYRPTKSPSTAIFESGFPLFEDILTEVGALGIPTPSLATMENLYYAVAILSCRTRPSESLSNVSSAFSRQGHYASRITTLMCPEFKDQITMLPFVPYALSLSLSIAYREMRHTKVPLHRAIARRSLKSTCDILEELGEHFWTASSMASMGKATLQEMDRVFASVKESYRENHNNIREDQATEDNTIPAHDIVTSEHSHPPESNQGSREAESALYFDTTSLNDVPDLDVFGLFDPSFDLEGVDAYFGSNLYPSGETNT